MCVCVCDIYRPELSVTSRGGVTSRSGTTITTSSSLGESPLRLELAVLLTFIIELCIHTPGIDNTTTMYGCNIFYVNIFLATFMLPAMLSVLRATIL